ncbi:MAG: pyridoxine 5'-phosphate synthase [Candidatus Omnitrophica bacterium]|nr:pyridoxine 5'-phosphate synthase [Candidatus Omnitrophota bacterium]
MPKLGINIDHVATLRQARRTIFPDPVKAALICENAGADSIICHLREDRRHIHDKDVYSLRKTIRTKLNLEMSVAEDIVKVALKVRPDEATLVPERRKELTTEGGLDVLKNKKRIKSVVQRLLDSGIFVSLFINPDKKQIEAAKDIGAPFIEIHTGRYADACLAGRRACLAGRQAKNYAKKVKEFDKIKKAVSFAESLGLRVNAGHGLDYDNVKPIACLKGMEELNIGFSVIARAVFVGLERAVKEMRHKLN